MDHSKERHFVLQGMRERVARIGSKLTVSASSGTRDYYGRSQGIAFREPSDSPVDGIRTILRRVGPSAHRYMIPIAHAFVFGKNSFFAKIADQVKGYPEDMTSLKRNRPRKLIYLIPRTLVSAPGVVMIMVLVVKNMTHAMSPPRIPALGLKYPAIISTAAVISVRPINRSRHKGRII